MQSKVIIKICLLLGDIFIMQIALFLTLFLRNRNLLDQFGRLFYNFIILYLLWILILFILNLYDIYFFKKPKDFLLNVVIFSFIALFSGIAYFYFKPIFTIAPKTILLLNVIVFSTLFSLWRWVFNLLLEIKGVKERVVIVGFQENLKEVAPLMEKNYDILAIFLPLGHNNQGNQPIFSTNTSVVGNVEDFKKIVVEKKATSVIFALDFHLHKDLVQEIFSHLPLTLNYINFEDLYEFMNKKVPLEYLNEIWFLEKISKPENKLDKIIKRFFDIILSIMGLLVFIIVFPIIALSIKLDSPGKVFYSQKRVGKNGKVFIIRKFRTMKEHNNQDKEVWREKSDDSVTRTGRILRRLHFDELPQSWSMLKGDLSFVGPRPEWTKLAATFEKEIPFYKQRYLVKPGIVGWAQINFPASHSIEEVKEKFQYDLYYIKNKSLLLDLEIILKTINLFLR